jgi:hypothetical protein
MDGFQRLEALLDSAGIDDVEEATDLLRRFKGRSDQITTAIDEFMLDFMTLVFVIETGEEGFEKPLRKLARALEDQAAGGCGSVKASQLGSGILSRRATPVFPIDIFAPSMRKAKIGNRPSCVVIGDIVLLLILRNKVSGRRLGPQHMCA